MANQSEYFKQWYEENKGWYLKARQERRRRRYRADDEYRQKHILEVWKRKKERLARDPELREHKREYDKQWYIRKGLGEL